MLREKVSSEKLNHRELRSGEFWREIPGYHEIDKATFFDHSWQLKNSIINVDKMTEVLGKLACESLINDVKEGLKHVPMSIRVPPYIMSLIDWKNYQSDPLRRQFLPIYSALKPDHPKVLLDSLAEERDSAVAGLTHRYPDKVLFLTQKLCPLYCRFCTRSYAVGMDTDQVKKVNILPQAKRWDEAFAYIRSREEVEDIVISGGDSYMLRAEQVEHIGQELLSIPHVRRMRFATRGPAVMPMKLITDEEWTKTLIKIAEQGRKMSKDVVIHTHFNHPNEITEITAEGIQKLFEYGITVRNQTVLLRGVNDSVEVMQLLVKRLSYINVHPYYVFQHDLVKGVEDLRTTVGAAIELEKNIRGLTAGFNTPMFVVDCPNGGGKRDIHSYEYYDRETGISVYRSPNIDSEKMYLYYDPMDLLPESGQRRWSNEKEHEKMIEEALSRAKDNLQ